jgi:glycosyltransferase involved in cell wall biosynthesis
MTSAMAQDGPNVLMVSADRSVVAGERGPFYYMLESFSEHWGRVDVIGTRPARVECTEIFGNVHLHHPRTGKLRQAGFIAETGRRLAEERPYAVITSHDYNPFYNGVGAWRISRTTGIPYVAEIHHVPGFPRAANLRERLDRWATRRYVHWANSRAAGFRVVNDVELPALLGGWGIPAERIHVLSSLYLDAGIFRPEPLAEPECDILFVGRLVPNKGVSSILEALAQVAREGGPRWKLRLLGRGPEGPRLDSLAARLGVADQLDRVDWVPDAEALAEVYRRARVLVCASLSEGGPRVVPEAMACGTPVITTQVGLVPDLVADGRDGLIYDGSTQGLAQALVQVLAEGGDEQRFREQLPPAPTERFERRAVIAHLADGLKRIAADARAR